MPQDIFGEDCASDGLTLTVRVDGKTANTNLEMWTVEREEGSEGDGIWLRRGGTVHRGCARPSSSLLRALCLCICSNVLLMLEFTSDA